MLTRCWWPVVDIPDLAPDSAFPAAALSPLLRAWRSWRDQPAVLASDILAAAARAGLVPRPDSSIRFSRHAPCRRTGSKPRKHPQMSFLMLGTRECCVISVVLSCSASPLPSRQEKHEGRPAQDGYDWNNVHLSLAGRITQADQDLQCMRFTHSMSCPLQFHRSPDMQKNRG